MPFFVFALVLGGILLGSVALGFVDHDDVEAEGLLSLNLRGIAYGTVVLGGLGAGLTLLGVAAPITWAVSIAAGIVTAVGVSALFQWLRRTESGEMPNDGQWYGVEGTLVVPFDRATRLGLVSAVVGGQVQQLPATWREDEPLPELAAGTPVIIERLEQGVAVLISYS